MKSGEYSMIFSCDGYRGFGSLKVHMRSVSGGSDHYRLEGQFAEAGNGLLAVLQVTLAPGVSGHRHIQGDFSCSMTGTSTDHAFSLYGVGLLGIIIAIECQWAGNLEGRMAERRAAR